MNIELYAKNNKDQVIAEAKSISAESLLFMALTEDGEISVNMDGVVDSTAIISMMAALARLLKSQQIMDYQKEILLEVFARFSTETTSDKIRLLWTVFLAEAMAEQVASSGISPKIFEKIQESINDVKNNSEPEWEIKVFGKGDQIFIRDYGKISGLSAIAAIRAFGKNIAKVARAMDKFEIISDEIFINSFSEGLREGQSNEVETIAQQ